MDTEVKEKSPRTKAIPGFPGMQDTSRWWLRPSFLLLILFNSIYFLFCT